MAKLNLSTYQPAFQRKDVRTKIGLALEGLLPYYRSQQEMTWAVPQLEKWFGKHQNDMYGWLRSNLLVNVRSYSVDARRATTYKVNQEGFGKVWFKLHGRTFDYETERARQQESLLRPYLDAPEPFALMYTKDGDTRQYGQDAATDRRLYFDAQNIEKVVRRVILKGCYDYDIQSAMPTLVLQSVAAQEGLNWREQFPTWARLLGNRKAFRESLADRLGISYQQAKEVCQGMFDLRRFNGGHEGISSIIGRAKTKAAKDDPTLKALRAEASDAWALVGLDGSDDGAARFRYYEAQERKVMNVIFEVIHNAGGRVLPFHDGFTVLDGLSIETDLAQLEDEIQTRTGYRIKIDGEQF